MTPEERVQALARRMAYWDCLRAQGPYPTEAELMPSTVAYFVPLARRTLEFLELLPQPVDE